MHGITPDLCMHAMDVRACRAKGKALPASFTMQAKPLTELRSERAVQVPIMLRSSYCSLDNMSEKEITDVGECPYDQVLPAFPKEIRM